LFSASSVRAVDLASNYDVHADGGRFVVLQRENEGGTMNITVVQNWYIEFIDRK
jgi:hypothetical protein